MPPDFLRFLAIFGGIIAGIVLLYKARSKEAVALWLKNYDAKTSEKYYYRMRILGTILLLLNIFRIFIPS